MKAKLQIFSIRWWKGRTFTANGYYSVAINGLFRRLLCSKVEFVAVWQMSARSWF